MMRRTVDVWHGGRVDLLLEVLGQLASEPVGDDGHAVGVQDLQAVKSRALSATKEGGARTAQPWQNLENFSAGMRSGEDMSSDTQAGRTASCSSCSFTSSTANGKRCMSDSSRRSGGTYHSRSKSTRSLKTGNE